jgi:protein-disulfide isomerase
MPRNTARILLCSMRALLIAMALLMPFTLQAQEFTPQQNEQIKNMIRQFLFKNPQALREAIINLQAYERKQQQLAARQMLIQEGKSLYRSPYSFVAGNPNGDVTLIEFFDYNCSFCRRSMKDLMTLISTDSNLKVIFKEFPILGDGSMYAARAAMASIKQGKYMEFHMAMMQIRGTADENSVLEIAEEIGLDIAKLKQDMEASYVSAEIKDVLRSASVIGVNGTPAYVVGDRLIAGAVGITELRRQIAEVRNSGS